MNVIEFSRIAPRNEPLPAALRQMTEAVRSQALNWVEDTGSQNNLSVALDPPLNGPPTRGLVLHVLVANANDGPVRINIATAGSYWVRRSNGADLQEDDLHVRTVAGMIFDGTNFQLLNYRGIGGAAGAPQNVEIFQVKIPFAFDRSDVPSIVRADFMPALDAATMTAGDVIAVKIKNTNYGDSRIFINDTGPIKLKPNGGGDDGFTLQGDLHEGDIVIFFYDGIDLWFTPNPEIDDFITYTVATTRGPGSTGQQFASFDAAQDAIRRKTIGARGFVTLKFGQGEVDGPIEVNHPSGDRLRILGTMMPGFKKIRWEELQTGGTFAFAQTVNFGILRARLGTEIKCGPAAKPYAISNIGPGYVGFEDLLLTDNPATSAAKLSIGFYLPSQNNSARLLNVAAIGCWTGFQLAGSSIAHNCYAIANGSPGFAVASSTMAGYMCVSIYNAVGWYVTNGRVFLTWCTAYYGNAGVTCISGSSGVIQWSAMLYNGYDLLASIGSTINGVPGAYLVVSPPLNVVGGLNSIVTYTYSPPLPEPDMTNWTLLPGGMPIGSGGFFQ